MINTALIGDAVGEMLISEMRYTEGRSNRTGKEYALITVTFDHPKNGRVVGYNFFPEESDFASEHEYNEALYNAWIWFESIAAAYIKPSLLVEAFKISRSPEIYVQYIWDAISKTKLKNSFVTLKTLPNDQTNEVVLPRYPFFIKSELTPSALKYTKWEIEFLQSWFAAHNVTPHISLVLDTTVVERKIPKLPDNLSVGVIVDGSQNSEASYETSNTTSVVIPPPPAMAVIPPPSPTSSITNNRPKDGEKIEF